MREGKRYIKIVKDLFRIFHPFIQIKGSNLLQGCSPKKSVISNIDRVFFVYHPVGSLPFLAGFVVPASMRQG